MIRTDGTTKAKSLTGTTPVVSAEIPKVIEKTTEIAPAKVQGRDPTRDLRLDRQQGEVPVESSGVLQQTGTPATPRSSGLAVRLAAMTAPTPKAGPLGTKTPTDTRPELSTEARLQALVTATTPRAMGPTTSASTTPSTTLPLDFAGVVKRMRDQIGPLAVHLSHQEVATAIGLPDRATDLKPLGPQGLLDTAHGEQPHFRLAASLARWMENVDFGATRAEVVASFLAVHPDVKAMVPHLDGNFLTVLQRAYPFMPQWAEKPRGVEAQPNGVDVWLQGTANAAKASLSQALDKISEIPLALPLTHGVGQHLTERQAFADHNVVLVQHMLGQAVPFVEAMTKAGMNVDNAEYVGIPYQQNPAVQVTLEKTFGIPVTVPARGDMDAMWQTVCASVDRAFERHQKNGQPILILDDGGYASKYIVEKYAAHQGVFKVVEQTTRGLTEIAKLDPRPQFPIVNVAGSHGKRFESNQIGDVVVHAVRKILDVASKTPARKPVLVVGAGKVGAAVAESFKGDGAKVTIFDPFITPRRKAELEAKGFTIITDKEQALKGRFLVVGCSGHRSIDMNDFTKMSSPVFLASASSKRVEIDTLGLTKLSTDDQGNLRRVLAGRVNEQETWHYWLNDGRVVTAMADGLPVNFQGVNSVAPELIDHTMALMLLAAGQATTATPSFTRPLIDLDHASQWQLQVQMDGLRAATPADATDATLTTITALDQSVSGTRAQWLEVARSPATPPDVVLAMYEHFAERDPMDPIALECLGSHHDATSTLADAVQRRAILPHIARLLNHESIPIGEQERLMAGLAMAAQDLTTRSFVGAVAAMPVAIEIDIAGGVTTRRFDPNLFAVNGKGDLVITHNERSPTGASDSVYGAAPDASAGWEEVRSHVLSQVAAVLLTHPLCATDTAMTLFGALAPTNLASVRAENVLALRRTPWPSATLEKLFETTVADLRRIPGDKAHVGVGGDVVPLDQRCRYVWDVLESFATHPGATTSLKQKVAFEMGQLASFVGDRFVVSSPDGWPVSRELGIPLPEYR